MHITFLRHSIHNRGSDLISLDYSSFLLKQGHQVTYWANVVNTEFPIDPKIKFKKIPHKGILGTIFFALSSRFQTDLLYVDLIIMACLAWGQNNKKVLYFSQDYDVSYYRSWSLRILTRIAYWLCNHILHVHSIYASEHLAREINPSVRPNKNMIVKNGIDLTKFFKNNDSKFISLRQKPVVVIIFVRQDYRKGLDIARKALITLGQMTSSQNWELWAIGNESFIEKKLNGVKISNLGFLSQEDLRDVLSAGDIYFSASRHEGFNILTMQAMACGCVPVVTQPMSMVQHNITGLVSPVENWRDLAVNLDKAINDQTLRHQLQKGSLKSAHDFDLRERCKELESSLLRLSQLPEDLLAVPAVNS